VADVRCFPLPSKIPDSGDDREPFGPSGAASGPILGHDLHQIRSPYALCSRES